MVLFRWILLAPTAIIAAVLATFPLHIVLYQTLTGSGIVVPYPETPERVLTPFVAALGFIWAGVWVAPSHKRIVNYFLFAVWIAFEGTIAFLAISGQRVGDSQLYVQDGGLGVAAAFGGGVVGVFFARVVLRPYPGSSLR